MYMYNVDRGQTFISTFSFRAKPPFFSRYLTFFSKQHDYTPHKRFSRDVKKGLHEFLMFAFLYNKYDADSTFRYLESPVVLYTLCEFVFGKFAFRTIYHCCDHN